MKKPKSDSKPKRKHRSEEEGEGVKFMEEDQEPEAELQFKAGENTDMCEALMQRYKKSSAPQHRHLCASAAAMRSILQEEGLPLTPPAYFAAGISALQNAANSPTLDLNTVGALSTFLSVLLPLVPPHTLPPPKSKDAATVLVGLLRGSPEVLSAATVRSLVKSLGLLVGRCDVDDWSVVELPFKTLLEFSVDRRPKVRRSAQMYLEKVFRSFGSVIRKKASKVLFLLFQCYLPLAIDLSAIRIGDGSDKEIFSKPKHLEVLHMLNALKLIFPMLHWKIVSKLSPELCKLLGCQFTLLTRHVLNILEVLFQFSREEVFVPEAENIISSLSTYLSSNEKNPTDIIICALALLKCSLDKLHGVEPSIWIKNFSPVFSLVAGFLNSEDNIAIQAANILKGLINNHVNRNVFLTGANQSCDDNFMDTPESSSVQSICNVFVNLLNACDGVPNEHTLAVISDTFLKLGDFSQFFLKGTVLRLSDLMVVDEEIAVMKHVHECLGCAVSTMGPENILTLIPISLHSDKLICSNTWLIPILKKYVVGSSLEFFMEHIVPLAKSIQNACRRAKKSKRLKDLQTCAHGLWDLLPSFCRYPIDTSQTFETLAKLLVVLLKEESFMHETIAVALQELVNQNKSIVEASQHATDTQTHSVSIIDSHLQSISVPLHYTKKTASKNIKALASCSVDLIQALTGVFFNSPPEKRSHLKEAIGCLASITESSKIKKFFTSLEKFQPINRVAESEKLDTDASSFVDTEQQQDTEMKEKEDWRCLAIELASSLVEGADEDLIYMIYDYIQPSLQAGDGSGQSEAYCTLSRIFKEHVWFYSARFDELMDLLLCQKSSVNVLSLRSLFACFQFLLVDLLKNDSRDGDVKAFKVLNEIILTLKDSNEDIRSVAYDTLVMISSCLKSSQSANLEAPLNRLFSMIIGYLSGSSPHIMSGAVAALSLLIYKDPGLCFSVPDLMPSVLVLLQSKAREIIKAVLGFMKVLVSCLHANELQKILDDIVNGVLPWSSVSKNHFRSKVRIIMEIVIRKCGFDSVELIIPEKYKRFFKTVVEQRQRPTGSKNAEGSDITQKVPDSSPKRGWKRTREGIPRATQISHSSSNSQGMKGHKKLKGNSSSLYDHSKTTFGAHKINFMSKSKNSCSDKNKRKDFHKKQLSGGKVMMKGRGNDNKRHKSEMPVSRTGASSQGHKHSLAKKLQQRVE